MYTQRVEIEKSVIISLFGDWTDNPFEIDELKKIIDSLDVVLFTQKIHQLIVRAIKKMNSIEKYKNSLPTIDMVLAYVEINAPKLKEPFQIAILDCMEKQPLALELLTWSIELLQNYKIKDELRSLE